MKVLVTGDRNWTDYDKIYETLLDIHDSTNDIEMILIEGGARGADTLAKKAAQSYTYHLATDEISVWEVIEVPADWSKYGKAAGPIRNQQMLDMEPDIVVAFHSDLANSKGTKDMVNRARKAGVKVVVIA